MRLGYHHASALCLGWALAVWSTVLSYRENPLFDFQRAFEFNPSDPTTVLAYGGFPARAFAYPMPPLGPGPAQSFAPLAFNFLFWATVTYLTFRWSGEDEERGAPLFGFSVLLAVASALFFALYLLLKFD